MVDLISNPYVRLGSRQAPNKFVAGTAAADHGDSLALVHVPPRRTFTTFGLGNCTLYNRSGGTCVMGMAVRLARDRWGAGTVASTEAFTDATVSAQDETADDLVLHDKDDSGSGILIYAETPFNVVGIVQGVAGDQTTPVLILEYWSGTAWVNIVAANYGSDTLNPGDTDERLICFALPPDWQVGGDGVGVPATRYNLRLRHTTAGAGTTSPVASQLFIGVSLFLIPDMPDGQVVSVAPSHALRGHRWGDALFPVFGMAAADNMVDVSYRLE
jgi:hypothetical protein